MPRASRASTGGDSHASASPPPPHLSDRSDGDQRRGSRLGRLSIYRPQLNALGAGSSAGLEDLVETSEPVRSSRRSTGLHRGGGASRASLLPAVTPEPPEARPASVTGTLSGTSAPTTPRGSDDVGGGAGSRRGKAKKGKAKAKAKKARAKAKAKGRGAASAKGDANGGRKGIRPASQQRPPRSPPQRSPAALAAELRRVRAEHHAAAVAAIRAGSGRRIEVLTDYTIRNQRMKRKLGEIREAAVPSAVICEAFLGMTQDEYRERRSATLRLQAWWRGALLRLTLARMRRRGETPAQYRGAVLETAAALEAAGHSASPAEALGTLDYTEMVRVRTAVSEWYAAGGAGTGGGKGGRATATAVGWQRMLLAENSALRAPGLLPGGRPFGFRHADLVACVATLTGLRQSAVATKAFSASEGLLQRCVAFLAPPRAVNAKMRAQAPSTWLRPVVGSVDVTREGFSEEIVRDCSFERALALFPAKRRAETAGQARSLAKAEEREAIARELARIGRAVHTPDPVPKAGAAAAATAAIAAVGWRARGRPHRGRLGGTSDDAAAPPRPGRRASSAPAAVGPARRPGSPGSPRLPPLKQARIEVPAGTMARWAERPQDRIDGVTLKRELGLLDGADWPTDVDAV